MPKVPMSENRVQMRSANVEAVKVASLSSGIVGNNVMEASQNMTNSLAKAGTVVADYFIKEKEKESQRVALEKSSSALGELDNLLYDTGTDDEGRPKGFLNRKLGQVRPDSVIEYDKGVNALMSKYSEGLDEDTANKLRNTLGTHARTLRDNVAKHQVTEMNGDLDNKFNSNMKLQIGNAASAANDEALSSLIGNSHSTIESTLMAKGLDAGSIQLEKQKTTDKMIETNIFAKLEKDPDAAKRTLENFKEHASPEFYQKVTQAIDGKRFENLRSGLYANTFSKMKLSDGEPDLAKIEKTIRSSDKFTEAQKEQLTSYSKARAMEDSQNKHRYDKDLINRFSNDVINLKKQGGTLDDAFKVAGKFGGDAVEVKEREDIAKKLWTDPGMKSDPDVLIALHEKNITGGASRAEIKQSFADNKISASDYVRLTGEHLSSKLGEDKKEDGLAYQSFKNQVNAKFSSSEKEEKADALLVYLQKTKGKTPEEAAVIGKQLLEETVTSKGWLFDTKKENFKIEKEKIDANSAVWGSLHQEIGPKEVSAIGGGLIRKGSKSWSAADVDKFAQEFGGIEAIKQGTPVNNAIKSLSAKGKMATAANVKAVLAIYKDGNF